MARVTVEDCITIIPNRFELVLAAAQRGRQISAGSPLTLDRDNDKNPVVALREIAEETVDPSTLKESVIYALQRRVEIDEPEDEEGDLEILSAERDLRDDTVPLDMEEELLADGLSVQESPDSDGFDLGDGDLEAGAEAVDADIVEEDDLTELDEMDDIDILNED